MRASWLSLVRTKRRVAAEPPPATDAKAAVEAPPQGTTPRATMSEALRAAAARHTVRTVIDVGASNGMWSALARPYFPEARFFLIEAQAKAHAAALEAYVAGHPGAEYVLAAAGPREGEIHFEANDPFGGVASETPTGVNDIVVPAVTVDAEVSRRKLPPPYLLKLDTHGFELPILAGAVATLARSELLVIEAYNYTLRPGALRFHELSQHLEATGFRCLDLVDQTYRPDGALWQFDMFFARADAPEYARSSFL